MYCSILLYCCLLFSLPTQVCHQLSSFSCRTSWNLQKLWVRKAEFLVNEWMNEWMNEWIQSILPYPVSQRSISLSSHLHLGLLTGLFISGFPINTLHAFIPSPCALHALPISSSVTWSINLYLAKITIYEAPHYTISCKELAWMIKQDVLLIICMLIGNYWQNSCLITRPILSFWLHWRNWDKRQVMENNGYMS
jgi:hypothetical protein